MKKAHKKALGVFGLVAVAVMTAFAAFMPVPVTQATSSLIDTVEIRIIGVSANAYITSPENNTIFTGSEQIMTYNYENVGHITVTIEYVDSGGNSQPPITIDSFDPTDEYGSGLANIDFDSYGYGYGKYIIRVVGEGNDGLTHEDAISVSYLPVTATVEEDEETSDANVSLNYNENSDDIDTLELNVYDKNGNLITELSPIKVAKPGKNVTIPFSETNLPAGEYIITVTALDENGNPLHEPYELTFNYRPVEVPDTSGGEAEAPDTGGFMATLNISKADYLITGLLVFFIVGVVGIYVVAKDKKNDSKKRR